jgi:hypothetical protein
VIQHLGLRGAHFSRRCSPCRCPLANGQEINVDAVAGAAALSKFGGFDTGLLWDTAQGDKPRFYEQNFDLGAAAEPASTQETLNWQAFSVGGHNRRHRNMTDASVMGCDAPARFF